MGQFSSVFVACFMYTLYIRLVIFAHTRFLLSREKVQQLLILEPNGRAALQGGVNVNVLMHLKSTRQELQFESFSSSGLKGGQECHAVS